jgi:enterochelin esterase-like enzyme
MNPRQAIPFFAALSLLLGLSACSSSSEISPTVTATLLPPPTPVPFTPSPIPPTATPTALTCLTQPGVVLKDQVPATEPPQEYLIYLPPCYQEMTAQRYPVIYLLHGQTFTQDQWVRLGVPQAADRIIHSGKSAPFIVVFPDDRYWNSEPGPGFGDRLINALIPYVDKKYRTLADRENRALGGLSRGGGWVVKLGFERPDLFGSLGLHSPAVFQDNAPYVERLIRSIPDESRPRLWLDAGDSDSELDSILFLEAMLTRNDYSHEFHFYPGDHSEVYWGAHVEEYLLWYVQAWNGADGG